MYNRTILVEQTDPEVWAAIQAENARQEHHIELIASENYASPAVMAAQGSQLTNQDAGGYPGKRYDGGCEHGPSGPGGHRLVVPHLGPRVELAGPGDLRVLVEQLAPVGQPA